MALTGFDWLEISCFHPGTRAPRSAIPDPCQFLSSFQIPAFSSLDFLFESMPASSRRFLTYRRFDSIFVRHRKTAPDAHFTQYPRAFLDLVALSEARGGGEWKTHTYR